MINMEIAHAQLTKTGKYPGRQKIDNQPPPPPTALAVLMTMSPVPAPLNYAEQVLREEAERITKLKESAAAQLATETKRNTEVKEEKNVKVNLKDEDNFPTLGKANAKGNI